MFDFFKKKKEYISCKHLEYGINFDYDGLVYCGIYSHSDKNFLSLVPLSSDIKKDVKKLLAIKKKERQIFRSGKITERCKDCFLLEKKEWDNTNKIKTMDITANRACNSNCIYCETHKNKEYCNSLPDIPIYNVIEYLIKKNKIDKNLEVHWGGGEPTLLKEFPQLVDLFLEKLEPTLRIYSSGIKYSEHIEKAIKLRRCILIISIDSGNKELYKRIKNVDKFDTVVENVRKYCKAQEETKEQKYVILKYILIPEVNDTEEYIYEFLKTAKDINCLEVRCDLEQNWYKTNKNNIELVKKLFTIMKYFDTQAKKMGLVHFFNIVPFRLIEMYTKDYETTEINEKHIK